MLGYSSHFVKVMSIKFIVNCLLVFGKLLWEVVALNNVCKLSNFIIKVTVPFDVYLEKIDYKMDAFLYSDFNHKSWIY